jgi:CheY-like chemotaxis protein
MKRILIVDDFELGRLVLREKLEMQGYTCQEVENGSEALKNLQTSQFDLVITDNQMPVMTGLEMIQSLANNSNDQQPPIILLTGNPSNNLCSEARKAGVQAVFPKPYDERDLSLEIIRILEPR